LLRILILGDSISVNENEAKQNHELFNLCIFSKNSEYKTNFCKLIKFNLITIIFTVTLFNSFKTENGMIIVYSLLLNIYFYSLYVKYNI